MEGTIVLNEQIESAKFGVVFPENKELKCFKDDCDRIFVQHPKHNSVYARVGKKNIKSINWNESLVEAK
jgi:exosome complex RNA-binding protein Csl4